MANLNKLIPAAFNLTQPVPVVPEPQYSSAYGQPFPNNYPALQSTALTFTPIDPATKLVTAIDLVSDAKDLEQGAPSGQTIASETIGWKAGTTGTRLCSILPFRGKCVATSNFSLSERSGFASTTCLTGGGIFLR